MTLKTWWKRRKGWEKGGMIFSIIGISISIRLSNCSGEGDAICWSLAYLSYPAFLISNLLPNVVYGLAIVVLIIIQYFLIGALIGFIIGKGKK